jgi:hypothetical protein
LAEQLTDFLARKFEPVPHIIGRGVLPCQGKLIVGGEPKTNKSWILLNIILDLARGRRIFDATYKKGNPVLPVTRAYRSLYLEMELGDDGLRDRLAGPDSGHPGLLSEIDCRGLPIFIKTRDTAMRLDTPDGREFIQAEIAATKPDVVFFDPLSKFHLSDENSSQETGAILRAADHIIEKFGCSVVFTHHTSKPYKDDMRQGGNRLRGSSAIFGDIDTFIEVTRKSSEHSIEPVLQLDFTLRRGEPVESLFVQRKRNGSIEWLGDGFEFSAPNRAFPKAKYRDL